MWPQDHENLSSKRIASVNVNQNYGASVNEIFVVFTMIFIRVACKQFPAVSSIYYFGSKTSMEVEMIIFSVIR